jgi:hypothetical protein
MDDLEVVLAERQLVAVLTNGTCKELLTFLNRLNEDLRETLFRRVLPPSDYAPLGCCIDNLDQDRMAVMCECGAPVDTTFPARQASSYNDDEDEALIQTPLGHAVSIGSRGHYAPVIEAVLHEARARGCLGAVMAGTFGGTNREKANRNPCLKTLCEEDFAQGLALLLDAGLDPQGDISTHIIMRNLASGHTLVHRAARTGAISCLRLLRGRVSPAVWTAMLCDHSEEYDGAPLMLAFQRCHMQAYEFLLSFHRPGGAGGPDLLPRSLEDRALEYLAHRLSLEDPAAPSGVERARALKAGWDTPTWAQLCLSLNCAANIRTDPLQYTLRKGWPLAFAALNAAGFAIPPGKTGMILSLASSAAMVDTALTALTAAEAPGPGEEAAVRHRLACSGPSPGISHALSKIVSWGHEHSDGARALLREGASLRGGPVFTSGPSSGPVLSVIPVSFASDPAEALVAARACLQRLAEEAAIDDELKDKSFDVLGRALTYGHIALAQLYVDNGADVFACGSDGTTLFQRIYMHAATGLLPQQVVTPGSPPLATLPPGADAVGADAACFNAAAARAHAMAADAEEERLLVGWLQNPCLLHRSSHKTAAWERWAREMRGALAARWLWQRMCAADPERARALTLPAPAGGSALTPAMSSALKCGWHRCVRFFVSIGVPPVFDFPEGTSAWPCFFEFAWTMVGTLPAAAPGKGSPCAQALLETLFSAVRQGRRFADQLADACIAAGARVLPNALFIVSGDFQSAQLPGEFCRILVWFASHV